MVDVCVLCTCVTYSTLIVEIIIQKQITSSISADAIAQCNITNLERCKVYDILARFYRGDQVLDMVYDVDSVMTSKLGIASYRACMALQTIHLSLIWRLGLPLRVL